VGVLRPVRKMVRGLGWGLLDDESVLRMHGEMLMLISCFEYEMKRCLTCI
jgi:hypothetical protein